MENIRLKSLGIVRVGFRLSGEGMVFMSSSVATVRSLKVEMSTFVFPETVARGEGVRSEATSAMS